jgi:uncharacterized protein YjiS (DUF1127 family)
MTATQLARSTHRYEATFTTRIAASAVRAWGIYRDWRARRATVHILRSLDRRTLKDIGVDPTEIDSTVYGASNERLRPYREGWSSRQAA